MPDVLPEEQFQTLKWQRGQGYYNAHKHHTIYPWWVFREKMKQELLPIVKRRYEAYVMSWILFHEEAPAPGELSDKYGERILAKVLEMVDRERERLKETNTGKGSQK